MTTSRDMMKEALVAIERLQSKLEAVKRAKTEPIAIIGCGLRYPGGVRSLDDLQALLSGKVDAVSTVPADRWDADALYSQDLSVPGKIITKKGGFLDRIDLFDPQFFGISPREANSLDPQQRLLLETAHEAMETAGIATDQLEGSATGVFVGISTTEYGRLMWSTGAEQSDVYSATGGAMNAASGRISFTYGFRGPCVAIDTACSSSLNAIHLACRSLRDGESNLALAGGVAIIAMPDAMVMFSRWGMLSPDGACKTFDASANGFARGEGCAMIALKRLSDAQADGNPILGLIEGSATNSDGRSSGMTVPSGPAQERMLREALSNAQIGPLDIDYIEAHGTGTPIGDPIEAGALGTVLCEGRDRSNPLRIGSLKTNLGHTEAASGIGGILKVLTCLRSESILPQLHFDTPNPGIDWDDLPLEVVTETQPWPRQETPRRAGISAFGFSGTNVHVIVAEAPEAKVRTIQNDSARTIPLSAETPEALRALAGRYADFSAKEDAPEFADIAHTLAVGRAHMMHRAAIIASSSMELREKLTALAKGDTQPGMVTGLASSGRPPRIAFLCTGQGAQYPGMSRGLYETEPAFRASIDRSAEILKDVLKQPLLEVLFPQNEAESRISETIYTQPALFAVEYAMAELWRSWGVVPSIVAGHSIGEYVAACLAGVMTHENALRLVAERGRLMQELPSGGAMAAVFATENDVLPFLTKHERDLAIAGVNGPEETVISGSEPAVESVLAELKAKGIAAHRLKVSHAFHSPLLDPILDTFEQAATSISYSPAAIPLISNLTGSAFPAGSMPDATYWRQHARGTVRFNDCITALKEAGADILIELGPQPALLGLVAKAQPEATWKTIPTLRRGQNEVATTYNALAYAYASGVKIDWKAVYKHRSGQLVIAPTYPFQYSRYWFDATPVLQSLPTSMAHPILGDQQHVPPPKHAYISTIKADAPAFLGDHKILGRIIFPAAAYVEMALAAGEILLGKGLITLSDLSIDAPLELHSDTMSTIHTDIEPADDSRFSLTIREVPDEAGAPWRTLSRTQVSRAFAADKLDMPNVAEARQICLEALDVGAHYGRLESLGLNYGPAFRGLETLYQGDGIAVGTAVLPDAAKDMASYKFHPALLDSVFHAISALVPHGGEPQLYLPTRIDRIEWKQPPPQRVVVVARLRKESSDEIELVADLTMETETGEIIARLEGLHAQVASIDSLSRALGASKMALNKMNLSWEHITRSHADAPEDYLIIGDGAGLSAALALATGQQLVTLSELPKALRDTSPSWVLFCASLESDIRQDADGMQAFGRLLEVIQTLESNAPDCGICVLTRGAKAVAPGDMPDLALGTLPGLSRTIDVECATNRIFQLDTDPHRAPDVQDVFDALALADSEPELAVRNGDLFAPRLIPIMTGTPDSDDHRKVLRIKELGDLDRLMLIEEHRRAPEPDEVEIAVSAAGLNFRDVLNALGMYPGDAGALGSECAGRVSRVGTNVSGLKPGDRVVALAGDSFASHVTINQRFVLPKPDSITFAEAVTLPNTYLTAALCYATAGGIKPGQRVLVHAAAGGVGLAAMRLALNAGAQVIATAGSDEKRAFVLQEGAAYAFDSRSASFGKAIDEVTKGEGVDFVINALSGDMLAEGMRVTRPGGAFLEIGKNNIWSHAEAAERAPHVNYHIVDLGEQIIHDPMHVRHSFEEVLKGVSDGLLAPLPIHAFPMAKAVDAFRFMANARHTGKVVILPEAAHDQTMVIQSDAAYLVTGGLTGLGLAAAERLAKRGAGEIILAGRSGDSAEAQATAVTLSKKYNSTVRAVACDISDPASVDQLRQNVIANSLPLRGVLHAAGVLDDAPLNEQTLERFLGASGPKVQGARNLIHAAQRTALDWLVLFSSSSAILGGPGQANYAAANSWLDSLAWAGRATGRPITSIGWGAWGKVGMAARLPDAVRERWERIGLGQIDPEEGLDAMEHIVGQELASATVLSANIPLMTAKGTTRLKALFGRGGHTVTEHVAPPTDIEQDILAAPEAERFQLIQEFLKTHIGRTLGYSAATLETNKPLSDLGFDSLMAVQVRNAVKAGLHLDIGLRDLLSGLTLNEAARKLELTLNASESAPATDELEPEWEEGTI